MAPIDAIIPENRIIGPNPCAHVPGINNAPEIGIPVNAPIPQIPDIIPNLRSARRNYGDADLAPIFLIGEIMATHTAKRLMNAPLTNP